MLREYPDKESTGIRQVLKNGHSLEFQWSGTEDSSTKYISSLQTSTIVVDLKKIKSPIKDQFIHF